MKSLSLYIISLWSIILVISLVVLVVCLAFWPISINEDAAPMSAFVAGAARWIFGFVSAFMMVWSVICIDEEIRDVLRTQN